MQKVPAAKVATTIEATKRPLPAEIQEALGELVGAAREGLLALSVGVGLGVVHELMELEVDDVVGPKGKHNPDRIAKRHGHEDGSMTLGGRRVRVRRPRVRAADDSRELPVQTYDYFACRDPLTKAVMDRMLAGVSTRKYAAVGEPVGGVVDQESASTSKSTVSALPPSITNRIAWSESRPRSTRSTKSVRARVAFSVEPSHSPSGIFRPSVEMPSATTWVRSAISRPSSIITANRTSESWRLISSDSAVWVRWMNSSDSALQDLQLVLRGEPAALGLQDQLRVSKARRGGAAAGHDPQLAYGSLVFTAGGGRTPQPPPQSDSHSTPTSPALSNLALKDNDPPTVTVSPDVGREGLTSENMRFAASGSNGM